MFFLLMCFIYLGIPSVYSAPPDLTFVGFVEPHGGIGKVAMTIHESLGEEISINFIPTGAQSKKLSPDIPPAVFATLNSKNKEAGRVALLTDLIWSQGGNASASMPKNSIIKLAYTMLENTLIPKKWTEILNRQFDAAVVPDEYLVKVYSDSGINIPVFVLPIPMMLSSYFKRPLHSAQPSNPFVFGDASANKNPTLLVEAFAQAFGNDPAVHLVMRASTIFSKTRKSINRVVAQFGLTNVTIESGGLLETYIDRLSSFDCFVNLSRGEGFSFIPREALALGIPVIITNNTASTTICNSGCVYALPSNDRGPANQHYKMLFNDTCGEQFDCRLGDVIVALRDVYAHYEYYIDKARRGREWVKQYNCDNPELQALYRTLIKPKNVVFGNENTIEGGTITTNSVSLYMKYQEIIEANLKL
jgi:glycosyltransferase involved in cell wall biosynthesis